MHVDLDLARKYNVAAPRYTSYPPATQFAGLEADVVLEQIRAHNRVPHPLSLYFHLPFCRELCWFCGCTNVITTRQEVSTRYLDYLERELSLLAPEIHPASQAVQWHLGGGTPTFLQPDELRRLGAMVRRHFTVAEDVEAGVEIDPRCLTPGHVAALSESGFRRASLGVQDFQPEVQKAVHRVQPREMTEQAVDWLRAAGFDSLNIDLIYGLPLQTAESFSRTLDGVIALQPDRLAVFNYAHVPWMRPAQKILKTLPSPEEKLRILALTIEKLAGAGYVYIGMDHFARETDELAVAQRNRTLQRNFQGYSTRGQTDIHAFGMSAISQGGGAYRQNHKDLLRYYAALDAGILPVSRGYVLSPDDLIRHQFIQRLMCDLEIDYAAMSLLLEVDVRDYFREEIGGLDDLEADGLLECSSSGFVVTFAGRLLIRNIAVRFDAYAPGRAADQFSKAI